MDSGRKKLSFVVTPDIEAILDREKKEWFYDRSRSYMIRELVMAGLRALKEESEVADGNMSVFIFINNPKTASLYIKMQ